MMDDIAAHQKLVMWTGTIKVIYLEMHTAPLLLT